MTSASAQEAPPAPVFVIGCGRSGTTLVFRALAEHPDFAWISNWSNRFGDAAPWLSLAALRHAPGVRALGASGVRPRPVEGYRLWTDCFPGFNRPARDLVARDCSDACAEHMRARVARHLAVQRRARFIAKYTGWSRIEFMDRAFPGARFVHVVRDGRAVAASLLEVGFWEGWRGPEQWRWGPLTEADDQVWNAHDRSFAVLAGLQWKLLVNNVRAAGAAVGERYREVRYEDFVRDPLGSVDGLRHWCGLRTDARLADRVTALDVRDVGQKWRRLDVEEQERLSEVLGPDLRSLGYEV